MQFTTDISQLPPEVRQSIIKKVRHEDRAKHDLGVVEQLQLKRLHDEVAVTGRDTNVGRQSMVISPGQYTAFMRVYGDKCWSDPDFGKWVLKQDQHADLRVKDVGTKVMVGWTPGAKRVKAYG